MSQKSELRTQDSRLLPPMPPIYLHPHAGGFDLWLKVVPNASRSRMMGVLGDRLKVAVASPAEAGKANAAVCKLLAATLGIAPAQVTITAGHAQPRKTATITGLPFSAALSHLP